MPDETEPIGESLDFDNPSFVFKPNEQHDWRQQGVYLICKSCEIQHATYVGIDVMLVGIDEDGKPILKRRSDIFVTDKN